MGVKYGTLRAESHGRSDVVCHGDCGCRGGALAIEGVSASGINNESRALFDVLAISEHYVLRFQRNRSPSLPPLTHSSLSAPFALLLSLPLLHVLALGVDSG